MGVVILSLVIAFFGTYYGGILSFFSGISYTLIGPVTGAIGSRRGKKINKLFTQQEIDEVTSEVILMKEKKTTD